MPPRSNQCTAFYFSVGAARPHTCNRNRGNGDEGQHGGELGVLGNGTGTALLHQLDLLRFLCLEGQNIGAVGGDRQRRALRQLPSLLSTAELFNSSRQLEEVLGV